MQQTLQTLGWLVLRWCTCDLQRHKRMQPVLGMQAGETEVAICRACQIDMQLKVAVAGAP